MIRSEMHWANSRSSVLCCIRTKLCKHFHVQPIVLSAIGTCLIFRFIIVSKLNIPPKFLMSICTFRARIKCLLLKYARRAAPAWTHPRGGHVCCAIDTCLLRTHTYTANNATNSCLYSIYFYGDTNILVLCVRMPTRWTNSCILVPRRASCDSQNLTTHRTHRSHMRSNGARLTRRVSPCYCCAARSRCLVLNWGYSNRLNERSPGPFLHAPHAHALWKMSCIGRERVHELCSA